MTTDRENVEVVYAVEGHTRHFTTQISPKLKVAEFAALAAKAGQLDGAVEIFLEDSEQPLNDDLVLVEHLSSRFAPLHACRPGLIKTTVNYNGRQVERAFRPNVTVAHVIRWAIGKDGLDLEGGPADYQLKHKGQVLCPDDHLGQVAHGKKCVEFDLVFKVKPQG